jgi:hypothetical protein
MGATMVTIIRQGDVLLVAVAALPEGAVEVTVEQGHIVLAHGEATGHTHAIYDRGTEAQPTVRLWEAGAERFLQVLVSVPLRHEEHTALSLPVGVYKLPQQVEYDGAVLLRRVED